MAGRRFRGSSDREVASLQAARRGERSAGGDTGGEPLLQPGNAGAGGRGFLKKAIRRCRDEGSGFVGACRASDQDRGVSARSRTKRIRLFRESRGDLVRKDAIKFVDCDPAGLWFARRRLLDEHGLAERVREFCFGRCF